MTLKGLLKIKGKAYHQKTYKAVPTLLTLANACCGFVAILFALQDKIGAAAFFILAAAFFDMLDGRVARLLRLTSYFGAELDSLADAISFCCAPAFLVWSMQDAAIDVLHVLPSLLFLCAGIYRLARFNTQPSGSGDFFIGLPTPLASLMITSLIITFETSSTPLSVYYKLWLEVSAIILGLLMVSSFRFPSFKRGLVASQNAQYAVLIVITGLVLGYCGINLLLILPLSYILASFTYSLITAARQFWVKGDAR